LVTTELEDLEHLDTSTPRHLEAARSVWMKAESGYYTMERLVVQVCDLAEREAIEGDYNTFGFGSTTWSP
jgi:hypothetical protein